MAPLDALLLGIGLGLLLGLCLGLRYGMSLESIVGPRLPSALLRFLRWDVRDLGLDELEAASPELAAKVRGKPAVHASEVPFELRENVATKIRDAESDEDARRIAFKLTKNRAVAEVLIALARWTPARRATREAEYKASLTRHLRRCTLSAPVNEHPEASWSSDDGNGAERKARPDLAIGKVLVELKADMLTSASVDRAMGQMLRYLLAWHSNGPSILAVCGSTSHELQFLVRHYLHSWRKTHGLAVTVYFKRGGQFAGADEDLDDLAAMAS